VSPGRAQSATQRTFSHANPDRKRLKLTIVGILIVIILILLAIYLFRRVV
jgi:flagellar biogenesis protein FliO